MNNSANFPQYVVLHGMNILGGYSKNIVVANKNDFSVKNINSPLGHSRIRRKILPIIWYDND